MRLYAKKKKVGRRVSDMDQVIKCLPSKALSSNPNNQKRKSYSMKPINTENGRLYSGPLQ
jgi:hypothetical protein